MANYFNTLNLRQQLDQLGRCRFMDRSEFATEADFLKDKKIVIVGCGESFFSLTYNSLFFANIRIIDLFFGSFYL